jgi:2-dehydropantoate 2-reductase
MSSAPATRLTVAVVGLGGIGGIAAGCRAHAGRHTVVACARRPLRHLTVERPEGTIDVPLGALSDLAQAAPADWVLLCTKAHETASAGPWLERLCRPTTHVAVMQNGIEHAARVAPWSNGATAVPVVVNYNAEKLGPGRVRLTHVADYDMTAADDAPGRAFAALFAGTPLRVFASADFTTAAWRKLLVNAVANPITALTLQRQAVFLRENIYALGLAVAQEAVAVGRADGAKFAADEAAQAMARLLTIAPELGSSMYFDRLAGRPLEIEALIGAVVSAGKRHDIATPLNGALLAMLRAVNDAAMTGHKA